jgi:pilus assembly protein CpaF
MPLPIQKPGAGGDPNEKSSAVTPPSQIKTPGGISTQRPQIVQPSIPVSPPEPEEDEVEYVNESGYQPSFASAEEGSEEEEEVVEPVVYAPAPQAELPVQPPVTQAVPAASAPEATPQPQYEEKEYGDEDEEEDEDYEEKKRRAIIASLSDSAKENAKRLLQLISNDDSSEVLLNGPHEIIFKVNGQRFYDRNIRFEDVDTYHKVINTLILHETDTTDRINPSAYLIEGQLELPDYDNPNNPPLFARVHIIAPPVVKAAKVTIAKKAKNQFGIDDLQARGSMSPAMAGFLKALARGRATVVFSGLSGSGKTTLLEAMSHHFDENDRLVVAEDTAELRLPLLDVVPLLASSRKPGQDQQAVVTLEWLVAQANRMRPDRIIVGEVRSGEMAEFLTAANSGADGSMTTVHASSPRQTIDKMVSLAMKSPTSRDKGAVLRDISSTVQIIVQTSLVDGKHVISQIEEVSDTVLQNNSGIATNPLFQYDRSTGDFVAVGRPSDKLKAFLSQRGVDIEPSWFGRGF